MNEELVYWCSKNVLLVHTGGDGLLSLAGVSRFAQEAAWYHAAHLGVGFESLQARGIAWVLREQVLEVIRRPALGEGIRIETWPTRAERLFCHRDFRLYDAKNTVVARGTTVWFGLDVLTRRPVKAETFFRPDWDRMPAPVFASPWPGLESAVELPCSMTRRVHASDLDALGHMNNLRYIDWSYDLVATLELSEELPVIVHLRHVRESVSGDVVELRHGRDGTGALMVDMRRAGDGLTVCLGRIQRGGKQVD